MRLMTWRALSISPYSSQLQKYVAYAANSGRGLLRTSTPPTLNRQTESACVCMSVYPDGKSCADIGGVPVVNDPPVRHLRVGG